jgi:Spy/CpxP family protein refolding chaperone
MRLGWKAWIAALALLVIGAAVGVTVDRFHHRSGSSGSSLHARVRRDPIGVIDRELNLRPEQRTRIAAILDQRQGNIDAVWRDMHVRLRATIDSVVEEIAAALDSSQAQRFRKLADELHNSPEFRIPPSH